MRSVVALIVFIAAVSFATLPGSASASGGGCKLLSDSSAAVVTGEDEVLQSEHKPSGLSCRFETGPDEPKEIPRAVRVRVSLSLTLARFNGNALKDYASEQCAYAHKGFYSEETCSWARKAVKAEDPLRSFQYLHRSFLEMGTADKVGGLGDPAFIVEFDPPLVGSELWIYREKEKKVLVATCIELRTSGKLPDNGHFPSCARAAAHAAVIKLP